MAPRIDLGDITHHNVNLLKLINQKVFPVNYNVRQTFAVFSFSKNFIRFYKDSTTLGKFCQFAYMDDLAVGAICARAGKFSRMAKPIGQIFLDFLFRLLSFYNYFFPQYHRQVFCSCFCAVECLFQYLFLYSGLEPVWELAQASVWTLIPIVKSGEIF